MCGGVFEIQIDDPRASVFVALFEEADKYYATLYPNESNHPIFADALISSNAIFLVARETNMVVGHVALVRLSEDAGEIKRLYVLPTWRRQGIGKMLLSKLIGAAQELKLDRLVLETGVKQPEAQNLYLQAGFKEIQAFPPYQPDLNSKFFEINHLYAKI